MRVDELEIRALCGEQDYERALALLAEAGVQSRVRRDATLQAIFPVQRGRPFVTSVEFEPDELVVVCNCRSIGRFCQHVGALLLEWVRRPESFAEAIGGAPVRTVPRLSVPKRPVSPPEPPDPRAELVASLQSMVVPNLRTVARHWSLRLRGTAKSDLVQQMAAALTDPAAIGRAIAGLAPDLGLTLAVVYLLGSDVAPKADEVRSALARLFPDAGEVEPRFSELEARGLVIMDTNPVDFGRARVPWLFRPHLPPVDYVARATPPGEGTVRSAGALADALIALWASVREGRVKLELRSPRRPSLLERAEPGLRELGSVPEEVDALVRAGRWESAERALAVAAREPELSDPSLAALGDVSGLPRPAVVFGWQLLRGLGLVEIGEAIEATEEPGLALLRQGAARRLHAVLTAWQWLGGWSELDLALAANPGLRLRRQMPPAKISYYYGRTRLTRESLDARFTEARRFVVRLLGLLPTDVWLSVESLQATVWKLWPDFLYGRERYAQEQIWWLEAGGSRLDSERFADWRRGPGAIVEALVAGPLHWLGLADLAGSAEHPTAFRLRPEVRLPRTGPPPAGSGVARIEIGPNLTVRVPTGYDDAVIHDLLTMAGALVEVSPRGFLYRLTIEGVRAAFEAGQTAESLLAHLQERLDRMPEASRAHGGPGGLPAIDEMPVSSPTPEHVPPAIVSLAATLRRWWQSYGRSRLYEGLTVLELGDDYVLPELLVATGLRQHLVYQFSPRLVAVDPDGADALIAELRRRGYTPLVETTSDVAEEEAE